MESTSTPTQNEEMGNITYQVLRLSIERIQTSILMILDTSKMFKKIARELLGILKSYEALQNWDKVR